MNSENRNKRDLPEVVADILITLDKVQRDVSSLQQEMGGLRQEVGGLRQEVGGLRQQMNEGFDRLASSFDNMTTAVLDAMCIVPKSDGVFSGLEFRTHLWDKYSTAAPAQQRQYGALSNTARKAYKA